MNFQFKSWFSKRFKQAQLTKAYNNLCFLQSKNLEAIKIKAQNIWNNFYCKYSELKNRSTTLEQFYGGRKVHLKANDDYVERKNKNSVYIINEDKSKNKQVYSKCTINCYIPNNWAKRIHECVKQFEISHNNPSKIISTLKQYFNPKCCIRRKCESIEKCNNIIKYTNEIAKHFQHMRTLRRRFYTLKALFMINKHYIQLKKSNSIKELNQLPNKNNHYQVP